MRFYVFLFCVFWFGLQQHVMASGVVPLRSDGVDVEMTEGDSVVDNQLAACQLVAGTWQYDKPYVHADGSSLIGKLGKPIAKSKLKKNLDKAFKKLKIKKRWNSLTLRKWARTTIWTGSWIRCAR